MSKQTPKQVYFTKRLKEVFKLHPESKTVEERYKTIRYALYEEYREIMDLTQKETMLQFLRDAIYIDRKLRELTEDIQQKEKEILSQKWQVENGYEVGYYKDIKQNKLI